jgi:hypothetical protein
MIESALEGAIAQQRAQVAQLQLERVRQELASVQARVARVRQITIALRWLADAVDAGSEAQPFNLCCALSNARKLVAEQQAADFAAKQDGKQEADVAELFGGKTL